MVGLDIPVNSELQCPHVYNNYSDQDYSSWLIRLNYSPSEHRFLLDEKKMIKNSLHLKQEVVYATFEYERDKMIVSLAPTDLLIVQNWSPVKRVMRNSENNINKFCFMPLPGFNIKSYPFIICSGFEHISLINVKEMFIQVFVKEPCNTVRGQQAFFFKEEKYGHSLHFASKFREGKSEQHRWHSLQLK